MRPHPVQRKCIIPQSNILFACMLQYTLSIDRMNIFSFEDTNSHYKQLCTMFCIFAPIFTDTDMLALVFIATLIATLLCLNK